MGCIFPGTQNLTRRLPLRFTDMASIPLPLSETVKTGSDGTWTYAAPGTLEPGYHRVRVDDGQGGQAQASFFIVAPGKTEPVFVVKDRVSLVDRVERAMPGGFGWMLAVSLLSVVCLAIWNVQLARKAEKTAEPQKRQRLLNAVMVISAATVVVAFSVGAFIHRRTPVFSEVINQIRPLAPSPSLNVAGAVVNVHDGTGVSGIDLSVGDTSIRTQEGGRYVFRQVEPAVGIRLTHPELKRAFVWRVLKEGELAIPYDLALYNALVETIDRESRGQAGQLYDQLPASDQASISRERFTEERRDRISSRRLLQQEVVLRSVSVQRDWRSSVTGHVWPETAQMEILFGDQVTVYAFAYDQGSWHPVR